MDDPRAIPEGGVDVWGKEEDGSPRMQWWDPLNKRVPDIGTIRFDDSKQPNGYFGSNGAWNTMDKWPAFTDADVVILPPGSSSPF